MMYITADQHWCHANIIKYCNRPFKTVEEMDKTMIQRWNSVVKKNDVVYHLGDFALTSKTHIAEIREQLNGKIHILAGNHDRKTKLRNAGFEEVIESPIIRVNNFLLSHAAVGIEGVPSLNVGVDNFNFYPIPFPTTNQRINLCGHSHNAWVIKCEEAEK